MMESISASTPWYRSWPGIILAAILIPPLGLILLWMRSDAETGKKVFGSVGILALGAAYVFLLFGGRLFVGKPDPQTEAHYAELERQRAQQRELATGAGGGPSTVDNKAEVSPSTIAANANESKPAAIAAPVKTARSYWTDFRGPARDGRYDEGPIQTAWPAEGLRLLWKQPIGGGYASFVVAEGVAFTIEQRRRQEIVAAYDVETGRELWTHGSDAEFKESMGGDGPRATPTWEAGRLYALGAEGDLRCFDAKTGKLNWSKNILKDNGADNLSWGMSGAPLIVDDKVVVLPGGRAGKSVVAYNKLTGAPVWRSLNDTQAYVSPMLVTLAGKRQILVETANRIVGLAVADGALLWESSWNTDMGINVSQPIVIDANRFFASSGYGKGAALIEVTAGGDGLTARKIWENNSMKNKFNSSVVYEGNVYGLDEGILTCLDVKTGERKWKGGRYGYGQVILASGHLIVITDAGELVLVKATPDKPTEVARFSALEGKTWNYPAIANGRLLVRNQTQMACFDVSGK
ncbi:MAG: PQQ-binding-like beta-propeller repeat protein [Acidobacteriota bacterium]